MLKKNMIVSFPTETGLARHNYKKGKPQFEVKSGYN